MPKRQLASTGELVDIDKDGRVLNADEAEKQRLSGKPVMNVKVYAPFKMYFEGQAYSLTAANETGPFDVLPHHHKFLCMLVPCNLVLKTPEGEKIIKIARALMHVKAEQVTVFVDV
jgi:F0F1-type ATP synthase epsilon subunit